MPPKSSNPFSNLKKKDEFYSQDAAWMQRAVLVTKLVPIWIAQCARYYASPVEKLSDIPDEELEKLAQMGFSVIWLVGLWQRSPISKKIKHQIGLEEAEASAYSIRAYKVDPAWGGAEALEGLQYKAARFGLRLGADMVPNHTALDAQWMAERPDLYLSTDTKPIEQYRFSGPNLSEDARYEIYLEDHYLDQSDAAVVFKRVDGATRAESYVYHGNDGILTPWNDTAQLDFSKSETREMVIKEMVRIAKKFSLLRLDAAMLLTSQHIQRLWFPTENERLHIPTREQFRLSKHEFKQQIPVEFWENAVQTLRREVPDTLLLAEAYWMLENYFAHSLGLHRVYNIQFMRLLGAEDNEAFRDALHQMQDRDPRLLVRRANFLSNPDEESAAYAFGTAERYFCLCTLLATLPGLPIFAHGQIEGYKERYAMDILKPYLDEIPDGAVYQAHLKQIAPLLRRRDLFAGHEKFYLLNCRSRNGKELKDVFAFCNGSDGESALVIVNNSSHAVRGRLGAEKPGEEGAKESNKSMLQLLGLASGESWIAKEFPSGEERELDLKALMHKGLKFELEPYEARVLWEFRLAK